MTTLRQITKKALRESNSIQLGTEPDNDEYSEAVDHLKTLIRSTFGDEMGEFLKDVNFGTNGIEDTFDYKDYSSYLRERYVPSNLRIIFNHSGAEELNLDPNPRDGARVAVIGDFASNTVTLVGNGRKIEDASSLTLSTDGLNREWFYRADLGQWKRVTDLDDDDEMPFPLEFDDYFIVMLAARVSPQYGNNLAEASMQMLQRARKKFKSKYLQKTQVGSEKALLALTTNRLIHSQTSFNFGRTQ